MSENQSTESSSAQIQRVAVDTIPAVRVQGVPTLWQMASWLVGVAIFIIGTLLTAGGLYLNKSLEATESKLNESITKTRMDISENISKSVDPINEKQAGFKLIISLLVSRNKELTADEKQTYSTMLSKISYEDAKNLLQGTPKNDDRRSLESLIRNKQVEPTFPNKQTGLVWNDGKSPAQVRYFTLKDPNLDLSRIDLYSEGSDPCSSKVLQLPDVPNATVQICEAHLNSDQRLELIIVKNAE